MDYHWPQASLQLSNPQPIIDPVAKMVHEVSWTRGGEGARGGVAQYASHCCPLGISVLATKSIFACSFVPILDSFDGAPNKPRLGHSS